MPSADTKYKAAVAGTVIFFENVQLVMKRSGLTVSQVSRDSGVDRATLSKWINGKGGNCSLAIAQKLADALQVPLWEMLKPAEEDVSRN